MDTKDIKKVLSNIDNKSYLEKFELWKRLLSEIECEDIRVKTDIYTEFLRIFPFNHEYWNSLAQMHANNGNNEEAISIYEKGLNMNPRSLNLWKIFCSWSEYSFNADEHYVRNCFERAISVIGIDYFSKFIWQKYIEFEDKKKNILGVNQIYWRLVDIPIKDLPHFIQEYKEFINGISDAEIIRSFYDLVKNDASGEADKKPSDTEIVNEENVRESIIKLYEERAMTAVNIANMKSVFENKLKMEDFDGKIIEDYEISNWLKYIKNEKNLNEGRTGNIIYVFEKAITHICHSKEIWVAYINYLKNDLRDEDFLLSKLKKYRSLFKNFFFEPIFEECDIEESKGNVKDAKAIYLELKEEYPHEVSVMRRLFQFHRRNRFYQDAENLMLEILEGDLVEQDKIFILKEYLDAKLVFKFQLAKDPNYFLERFLRRSSFNLSLLTIIFNYLLQQDKAEGMSKVTAILDRYLLLCRQSGNEELLKKANKFYSSILRTNGYKINEILGYEKEFKDKSLVNILNPEVEPIWAVKPEQEDEENLRKIAEKFTKNIDDGNTVAGPGKNGHDDPSHATNAQKTLEEFMKNES